MIDTGIAIGNIKHYGTLAVSRYAGGAVCLTLMDGSYVRFHPTANVVKNDGAALAENEVALKTWAENEGALEAMVAAGVIEPTPVRIQCGMSEAVVCTVRQDILALAPAIQEQP